jgi:prepilin-type processing-associated H-X9-DG protein
VELLAVIAILAVLMAMLMPAIQTARESSRLSVCQNNLRMLGLAIANYVARNNELPIGAKAQQQNNFPYLSLGTSWWVEILPDIEQSFLYDELDLTSENCGQVLLHNANGKVIDGISLTNASCPSSDLTPFERISQFQVFMPSYVGIAGATNDSEFEESRTNQCCVPRVNGEFSAGGTLVANEAITVSQITDGLSETILIAESSAPALDSSGRAFRIDGGFRSGWISGTSAAGTPPGFSNPSPAWNITSIRYGINENRYGLDGIYSDKGANNPSNAPHVEGANILFVDGSVHLIATDIDLLALKRLATRDDATPTSGSSASK